MRSRKTVPGLLKAEIMTGVVGEVEEQPGGARHAIDAVDIEALADILGEAP